MMRTIYFLLGLTIFLWHSLTSAQIMDSTASVFGSADYALVPFSQILESPRDNNETYRWTAISGLREDLVKARVFLTGQRRKTETLSPAILNTWVQARNLKARVNWMFDTELEITDGSNVMWLPVISSALDNMKNAKQKGEVEILIHRLELAGTGSASILMTIQSSSESEQELPSRLNSKSMAQQSAHRKYVRGALNFSMGEYPISLPLIAPSSLDILTSDKKALYLKFASEQGVARIRVENISAEGIYDIQETEIIVMLTDGTQNGVSRMDCKAQIDRIDDKSLIASIDCPVSSEQSADFVFSNIMLNAELSN